MGDIKKGMVKDLMGEERSDKSVTTRGSSAELRRDRGNSGRRAQMPGEQ